MNRKRVSRLLMILFSLLILAGEAVRAQRSPPLPAGYSDALGFQGSLQAGRRGVPTLAAGELVDRTYLQRDSEAWTVRTLKDDRGYGIEHIEASTAGYGGDCPVTDVEAAFAAIPEYPGFPLSFSYWSGQGFVGDDPTNMKHYQDITRANAANGTPYLILTKNGNPLTVGNDYPAELVVARMGSRSRDGEFFDTNCQSIAKGKCILGSSYDDDHIVYNWHFTNGYAPGATIGWRHAGSGQIVDDTFVVPLEKTCSSSAGNDPCDGDEEPRGAIALIDLGDLPYLRAVREIQTYDQGTDFPTLGVLGVAKQPSGKYLFVVTGGDEAFHGGNKLWFLESTTNDLLTSELIKVAEWDSEQRPETVWDKYQMLSFVSDSNKVRYLIGTDQTGLPFGSDNYVRLYRVDDRFELSYVSEKLLTLDDPVHKMGDLDTAASIYVSPSGKLILYTGCHDNDGWEPPGCSNPSGTELCKTYQMGEFPSAYYNDDTPPTTTHTLKETFNQGCLFCSGVQVTLIASDPCGSGVREIRYRLDGRDWHTHRGSMVQFTVASTGTHVVSYYAVDQYANTEATQQATFQIDDATPTGASTQH
jgi:hypothetical protein